ncbi:MAG: hypothetical protein ABJZ69_17425 [Hyphomicrobiales bacterium]
MRLISAAVSLVVADEAVVLYVVVDGDLGVSVGMLLLLLLLLLVTHSSTADT